jgi:acyl-CoA synthetase (AMP-forming)/AMP-acid ligase II/3-hydroxymyristoyl/3-hydroxydecanoyl-(acyl carrier protein) dehydratase
MPSRTTPLSQLFREGRPDAAPVAFGRDGARSFADFERDVAALAAAIEPIGAGRWLLDTESAYAACVGLLALAQTGGVALLPTNRQPETLRRLRPRLTGALIDPARDASALADLPRLAPLAQPAAPLPRWRFDRDAPFAELETSGTSGEGRWIPKLLRHLEDEVATLEQIFGSRLPPDTRVFATVSHQHIYGLLFRALWPLCAGRAFHASLLLLPQELFPRVLECRDAVLVTTPVHLRRMTASPELARLRGVCRALFSSGGPLEAETAAAVADALGAAPIEILGSTETGGVAVRERRAGDESFTPMPGVALELEPPDDGLVVTSAFVSVGLPTPTGARRFRMGDRAELLPGGDLRLLGRSDRTVKIGEKRLSLPEMEKDLAQHPAVSEVALLVLPQATQPRVHAALVLSETGRRMLVHSGRRALWRALAGHLAQRWDAVLLPRVWRAVDALPRNAQGKLPVESLAALFATREREAILHAETRGEGWLERELEVPAELVYLDGHYDGQPLVAAVVELRWVMEAAFDLFGRTPRVREFEVLKFPELLLPGQRFRMRLERSAAGDRLEFQLAEGRRVFASGRCRVLAGEGDVR